jgi:demethylmenaquinone methyltransferase/2-methoxy-6-polyprenyl-1,4-benzoquinol methylase
MNYFCPSNCVNPYDHLETQPLAAPSLTMPDPAAVSTLFARIAPRYDLANRLLSGGMDTTWRRRLVAAVRRTEPAVVLDVATGSGDVAFALARGLSPATQIVGMDFCEPMLQQARAKQAAAADGRLSKVEFRTGDGLALPIPDASVDAVTISFGLRNLADRAAGLREARRVLRPAGSLFILEFSQPAAWFRPIYLGYLRYLLPRLAGWVTGDRAAYVYLNQTIEAFPGRDALAQEIRLAGFSSVCACPMTLGIVALHTAQGSTDQHSQARAQTAQPVS